MKWFFFKTSKPGCADINVINAEFEGAKAMPKTSAEEKELREFFVELAQKKKDSYKAIKKHRSDERCFLLQHRSVSRVLS